MTRTPVPLHHGIGLRPIGLAAAFGLVCALAACGADGPPTPPGGGTSPVAFHESGTTVSMTGDATVGIVAYGN